MKNLYIDIETYSATPIDNGVYEYAADKDFQLLLFGYSIDKEPVKVIDLAQGEEMPEDIKAALSDPRVLKHAHNAAFERVCLSKWLGFPVGTYLDPSQWRCTMVKCAYYGIPLRLETAGLALHIDKQKLASGKRLIPKFCVPTSEGRPKYYPEENPVEWETFKEYNIRDVEAEIDIDNALPDIRYNLWDEYAADQRINDTGCLIDTELVDNIVKINRDIDEEHLRRFRELTYCDNPKSVTQLKAWFAAKGYHMDSLDKKAIASLKKTCKDPDVLEALELRQLTGKSSISKYTAMQDLTANSPDHRARGCFQFYGSHTGRWAGRHIQLQNLPQNHLPELDSARQLVKEGDAASLEMLFDNLPQVFSELIRTAIIAPEGKTLIVADFSAIEARVIAWVAGENWKLQAFKDGKDLYCSTASAMFGVPVEKHGVNGDLRQKGKIAELACGYGGSVGALKAFGAVEMGLKESELDSIVQSWRSANPNIVKLWWAVGNAALTLIKHRCGVLVINHKLKMSYQQDKLLIQLPSGRLLVYPEASIGENKFGGETMTYKGLNSVTHQWEYIDTYGPRLVENIVQAIARDLLTEAILRIQKNPDCQIVAHVHDEIIIEADPDKVTLDDMVKAMCELPEWGEGLILNAAGFTNPYYMKD